MVEEGNSNRERGSVMDTRKRRERGAAGGRRMRSKGGECKISSSVMDTRKERLREGRRSRRHQKQKEGREVSGQGLATGAQKGAAHTPVYNQRREEDGVCSTFYSTLS